MCRLRKWWHGAIIGLLVGGLMTGTAWADRGSRGGGGDRGGGGGRGAGQARSFSGGEQGGGGRSRGHAWSGGGGGSARAFRSSGGGEPSLSTGMSTRGPRPSYRPGSSSSDSSSGATVRSLGRGAPAGRGAFDAGSQSFNHSAGRANRQIESFGPSGRGRFGAGPSVGSSVDSSVVPRTFSREGQSRRNEILNDQLRKRSERELSLSTGNRYGLPNGRPSWDSGRQSQQVRRLTDEQVSEFLKMRGNEAGRIARDRGNRERGGNDGVAKGADEHVRRLDEANVASKTDRRSGGRARDADVATWLDEGRRHGKGTNGDHDLDARPPRRPEFGNADVERKYKDWRKHAWTGDRGHGKDHRDWSGRWRDGDRFESAKHIRNHWRDRHWHHHDLPFRHGWWNRHRWHTHYWTHWDLYSRSRPYYWWRWCDAPVLTSWVSFGWPTPYYWDYGPGEYIYCSNGAVYVNGTWYQPMPIFYENTVHLVERAPNWTAEEAAQAEWLPLGVFAVTRDGEANSDLLVQLAVTKAGVVGGTAQEQKTGQTYPVEGLVDKQTQRTIWSYTDNQGKRIVMETSVYNLTQSEATGLVHFGPNDIRVIELVRLDAPSEGPANGATEPASTEPLLPPQPK